MKAYSDTQVLAECYIKVLTTEGIFDRVGARAAGAVQTVKNVGSGIKAAGQALTGNTAGAQATVQGMQNTNAVKMQSILKSSARNFLNDLLKLKLIPAAPTDKDVETFITAVQPLVQQMQTPAPAAPSTTPYPYV